MKLLGFLSYSNAEMCDPSFLIGKLLRVESPMRVGVKSRYWRLASSSGSTLKHFWKGILMDLAWFR